MGVALVITNPIRGRPQTQFVFVFIGSHASNRVVLDSIFSNANSNYFRGKFKIETVLNKKKIKRYGQRFPQGYSAYGGSG